MGLDFVELVLRTEEVFAIERPDDECSLIRTVGDLYCLVLEKLQLSYMPSMEIEANAVGTNRLQAHTSTWRPWSSPDVWVTLKALIEDHLGIKADEVKEGATFLNDLGCE